MKRTLVFTSLLFTMHASSQNAIFNGGNGDGYSYNGYAEVAANIFNGGSGDGWATAGIMVSLPVHFTYFKVKLTGASVLLEWETSSEQNADKFEIERSDDGVHFKYLGMVAATGAANVRTTYQYRDNLPLAGDNYYRIKQIDDNGNFTYTPVRMLSLDKLHTLTLLVYPQPANDKLMIRLPSVLNGRNVVLNVINSGGGLEKQLINYNTRTDNSIVLPVGQLAKGIYFLHVHSGDKVFVSSLVID